MACGPCATLSRVLSPRYGRSQASRRNKSREEEKLQIEVTVEAIRVFSYASFFFMVIVAVAMNKNFVQPELLKGPKEDGSKCPPFDGAYGDNVDPPVEPGEGFDISTQSHLVRVLGYNNICANWDYSPSREVTAMVYPLFEYSLVVYLFFEFINVHLHYLKGWVSKIYYNIFRATFIFMLIGCSWFRMIFVVLAYQDISGHTAGFLCMQITLILVAIMNTFFILDTKTEVTWLGGRIGTSIAVIIYLTLNLVIGPVKLYLTGVVVFQGQIAPWSLNKVGGVYAGEVVDNLWFVCNAVFPLIVAIFRWLSEKPLKIIIDLPTPNWVGEDVDGCEPTKSSFPEEAQGEDNMDNEA